LVWRDGRVSVDALADTFAVSVETIRRDLGQLADRGKVQKVHGGATRLRLHAEGTFQERMAEHAESKRVIAAKLTSLVEPGDTLFIDTGSTTVMCAEALTAVTGLTVITNSVRIAQIFGEPQAQSTVYLLGGAYGNDNAQTLGPMVIEQIRGFQADHAILTVAAIDPAVGAMDANIDEAQVARAMVGHARRILIVADLEKFGRKAAFQVCRTEEIDVIVSEALPGPEHVAALEAGHVELR
jgi:DeoR family glycerol-3-phosphate regulon repressor